MLLLESEAVIILAAVILIARAEVVVVEIILPSLHDFRSIFQVK